MVIYENKQAVIHLIQTYKIIAIVRHVAADKMLALAGALYKGGVRLIEVTYDQTIPTALTDTAGAIKALKAEYGGKIRVGAGTVLNVEQLTCAAEAGAEFILAPNVNEAVIKATKNTGLVSIPGAMTPTEIERAHACGADFVKLFPAGDMGLSYVKALRGPLGHIPLIAVGGIDEANISDFIMAGVSAAGIGSNIVKESLIAENRFDDITKLSQKYTNAIGVI